MKASIVQTLPNNSAYTTVQKLHICKTTYRSLREKETHRAAIRFPRLGHLSTVYEPRHLFGKLV